MKKRKKRPFKENIGFCWFIYLTFNKVMSTYLLNKQSAWLRVNTPLARILFKLFVTQFTTTLESDIQIFKLPSLVFKMHRWSHDRISLSTTWRVILFQCIYGDGSSVKGSNVIGSSMIGFIVISLVWQVLVWYCLVW